MNEEPIKMEKRGTERYEREYLLELVLFMTSSARDVISFKHYAPNRLLRSLTKVLDLPNHIDCVKKDRFLEVIRAEIEKNRSLARDKEALKAFLDKLILKILKEYERQLSSKGEE